jgi:hypothetical protein
MLSKEKRSVRRSMRRDKNIMRINKKEKTIIERKKMSFGS